MSKGFHKGIVILVFCLTWGFTQVLPESWFVPLFCRLPALLASLYLNVPCEGTSLFVSDSVLFEVKRSCGGSDFFVIVCTMVTWYYLKRERAWVRLLLLLPALLLLTNLVNSLRVVALVWVYAVSEAFVPERFNAALHLSAGVMIFFPALLGLWWLCKQVLEVENERRT
jgi:exosortase K